MKIQILIDNKSSWILNYINSLIGKISSLGHVVSLIHFSKDVAKGDVLFLLSCNRIFNELHLNKHNIVIHESDLPEGKGFSPLTWQILEGKNSIPVSLFEANSEVDSGDIYFREFIKLSGHELINEIRDEQFKITEQLILKFLKNINSLNVVDKKKNETFYRKRDQADSVLDINKTIKEQFNLLRVVDNDRYPAYFKIKEEKYLIKISKSLNND